MRQLVSSSLGVTGTLTTADITTTGTHTVTGQSDIDWVRIKDHTITTNASNASLEILMQMVQVLLMLHQQ